MGKEKKEIGPVLLKLGVAIALSLGGVLYSFLINKRIRPSQSPPDHRRPSDCSSHTNSGRESRTPKSDHHAFHKTTSSCNLDSTATDKREDLHHPNNSILDLSPSSRSNGDKDSYLLPEFNDLVKEFDLAALKANSSPRKDMEFLPSDTESPKGHSRAEKDGNEQEIKSLRNLVMILKERERNLEIQLLEYYGLKEQETAVMELQNRLKLSNMEAKLFTLRIESLQADNRRLEAQMADYAKVVTDLEAARSKIKVLKKKLRTEAEQNKEQILVLQQRVKRMQEEEHKGVVGIDPEIQLNLDKLRGLEAEVEELRKANQALENEKSDLAQRLESVQIIATSVLEDEQTEKLKEETQHLRQQNEDLSKEIERLHADRCADVEELVYLKWINACLRYELRNYQPGPGKTIARDLSKTLSPKSEEKAKQLILEYANKEGPGEKAINISEVDSDQWSSSHSQASFVTDSGEFDESGIDDSPRRSNTKFFGKLMKVLRGKDKDSHHHHHHNHSRKSSTLDRAQSADVNSYIDSHLGSSSESHHRLKTPSVGSSKYSSDSQRSNAMQGDTGGSLSIYKRIHCIAEGGDAGGSGSPSSSDGQRSDLVKYAEVLKDSGAKSVSKFRRRSSSYSSF